MVRAERIASREKKLVEDALRESRVREECEARRYEKYYNIDMSDFSVYVPGHRYRDLGREGGRLHRPGRSEVYQR